MLTTSTDPDASRLAVRLDGLPLALATAGTYLGQVGLSCAEYLSLYETAWDELHGPDFEELLEYEDRTLTSTWTISLDQVRSQDPDAADLFQFLGYLSYRDIWYELIEAGADEGPPWIARITTTKIRFTRAMSKLQDYSLVEAAAGTYRVHPCLHDWILQHLNNPPDQTLFLSALYCLHQAIPDSLDPQYWTVGRRLLEHIQAIQHHRFTDLWAANASDPTLFEASDYFGELYLDWADYTMAEKMVSKSLAAKERVLGMDDVSTLETVGDLATIYRRQDRLVEAEQLCLRALAGLEEVLGSDHSRTITAVYRLGDVYDDQDRYTEAEQMYRRALTWRERELGPDHVSTLHTLNGLAILYAELGELSKAEQMYERSLAGKEKVLGPDRPSTLETVNNLAILYRKQGMADKATQMFHRALSSKERVLGPDHMSTLDTVHNLGGLYRDQGRLDEAEQMYKRALKGCEKVVGLDHKSTLATVDCLGGVYLLQGKLDQAEVCFNRVLSTCHGADTRKRWRGTIERLAEVLNRKVRKEGSDIGAAKHALTRLIQYTDEWGKDNPAVFQHLAEALLTIKDDENAQIAFVQAKKLEKNDAIELKTARCDVCDRQITLATGHHICRECKDTDLCSECMSGYASKAVTLPGCHEHEYFDAGTAVSQALESGKDTNVDMDVWFEKLKKQYDVGR